MRLGFISTVVAFLATIFALSTVPAYAADQDALDCNQSQDVERQILGCTRLLARSDLSERNRAIALNKRGLSLKGKGDVDRALSDFNASVRADPKISDAYHNRADLLKTRGEYDRAVADYGEAIKLDPKSAISYRRRGDVWELKGEHDRAIADYDMSVQLDPKSDEAFSGRGTAWGSKGEQDRAIADYSEAIKIDPDFAGYYNNRAGAFEAKGDHEGAIVDYDAAIRLNPKIAVLFNGRGNAWKNKRDYDRAMTDYNEAIRLDAKYSSPHNGRGVVWGKKGQIDRALADYDEALRLDPNNADSLSNRAGIWEKKGDYDRALSDLVAAVNLQPKNPVRQIELADVYRESGDLDRAMAAYGEALRLDPKLAVAYANRALLWIEAGEFDRALADCNEAIRLDPKLNKAWSNRGQVWRMKGDLVRALADQDHAIPIDPADDVGYILRGETLRYKGDFAGALADYDLVLKRSEDAAAATGRALTYEKMGDRTRARADFQRALAVKLPGMFLFGRSAQATARARLAAFDSGALQPVIAPAPAQAASATSVPTPAVALPAAPAGAIKQGRRVALVIGNSTYKNVPVLANPQRDATAIAGSLRAIGFETVTLANDVSRKQLTDALRAFSAQAEKADWAVVYYAGHGMEVNGINYLIPVEARIAVDRDIQAEAVPLDQVMAAVDGARKIKLVLLDACRNNPFAPQMQKTAPAQVVAASVPAGRDAIKTRSIGRGLSEVKVSGATLVVYAAKHGQTALDGDGGNSPFAVAMTQRVATPNVEINKLFRLVRDDVMEATAGRQEPYTYGSLPGREDFFFVAR